MTEKVISDNSIGKKTKSATTTITPVFTEIVLTKEVVSNLNVVDADDDVDNAKLPLRYKNLIGDLDGIDNKYYQVKGNNKDDVGNVRYDGVPDNNDNYGVIYDRSDDVNPPPLPPESPAYAINIPRVHYNKPNNGEILSLPLFSLVYQVE